MLILQQLFIVSWVPHPLLLGAHFSCFTFHLYKLESLNTFCFLHVTSLQCGSSFSSFFIMEINWQTNWDSREITSHIHRPLLLPTCEKSNFDKVVFRKYMTAQRANYILYLMSLIIQELSQENTFMYFCFVFFFIFYKMANVKLPRA